MKKNLLIVAALFAGSVVFAQEKPTKVTPPTPPPPPKNIDQRDVPMPKEKPSVLPLKPDGDISAPPAPPTPPAPPAPPVDATKPTIAPPPPPPPQVPKVKKVKRRVVV